MIKYGFTGTRDGMNNKQKEQIEKLLQNDVNKGKKITVIHGDCVGADEDFHNICQSISEDIIIRIYPGYNKFENENNKLRANCKGDYIAKSRPYLDRNRDIVNDCDILIGCPKSNVEEQRSGTWYTIRYARKIEKQSIVIV
jgi:hypothetical protein